MNDWIVVCGGTGFVGRALIADLKNQGIKRIRSVSRSIDEQVEWKQFHNQRWEERDGVEYVSADLSNENQALGVVRNARLVYNLAASVGGIDYIQSNRSSCMLSAQININLLKACQAVGAQRYFFASSACVYGSQKIEQYESGGLEIPERGYGWEKFFGEQLCREFREDGNVDTRVARYFTLYGPGDNKKHNHFPAAICKKIATAKLLGHKSIDVWGDGTQIRSLLYIDDCVEGTQRLMNSGVTVPVNLSSPRFATVKDMVAIVQEIAGTELQVNYVPGVVGVHSRFSDNSLIREKLGWEPSTTLEDGLRRTWSWWWDWALRELSETKK